MQLTPAQMGMRLLIHGQLHVSSHHSRAEGMARGRQMLVTATNQDFSYDLLAWHYHLTRTNAGGYNWPNDRNGYFQEINAALVDNQWHEAVRLAESESLFERLKEFQQHVRDAEELAQRTWGGKMRSCPQCQVQFTSVRDRGQCPGCGHIFFASRTELTPASDSE